MDYLKKAYSPYYEEMYHCLLIDIPILLIGFLLMFILNAPLVLYAFIGVLFGVEIFLNYKLPILSLFERKFSMYSTESFDLIRLADEWSASGHLGSVMTSLYPDKMRVCRYKILSLNSQRKKFKLRCVMSAKKSQILSDKILREKSLKATITYGRLTRIVIKYEDKDEWAKILNLKF